jgi:drug/metabolite transporter (DMT)-like permease
MTLFTTAVFTTAVFTTAVFTTAVFTTAVFTTAVFTTAVFTTAVFTAPEARTVRRRSKWGVVLTGILVNVGAGNGESRAGDVRRNA